MWASAPTGGRIAAGAERPYNDTSSGAARHLPLKGKAFGCVRRRHREPLKGKAEGVPRLGARRADVGIGPYGRTGCHGRGAPLQ